MKDAIAFGFIPVEYDEITEQLQIHGAGRALTFEILASIFKLYLMPRMALDATYNPTYPIRIL